MHAYDQVIPCSGRGYVHQPYELVVCQTALLVQELFIAGGGKTISLAAYADLNLVAFALEEHAVGRWLAVGV